MRRQHLRSSYKICVILDQASILRCQAEEALKFFHCTKYRGILNNFRFEQTWKDVVRVYFMLEINELLRHEHVFFRYFLLDSAYGIQQRCRSWLHTQIRMSSVHYSIWYFIVLQSWSIAVGTLKVRRSKRPTSEPVQFPISAKNFLFFDFGICKESVKVDIFSLRRVPIEGVDFDTIKFINK